MQDAGDDLELERYIIELPEAGPRESQEQTKEDAVAQRQVDAEAMAILADLAKASFRTFPD